MTDGKLPHESRPWRPIESAPPDVRDLASRVQGEAGRIRCRVAVGAGAELFAFWCGPSHGDPVTHYQSLGGMP